MAGKIKYGFPVVSQEDPELSDFINEDFLSFYEVYSYRNSAKILKSACSSEVKDVIAALDAFRISVQDILTNGGNKSKIAKKIEEGLYSRGWREMRIQADMVVTKNAFSSTGRTKKIDDSSTFVIENYIDGHKIDFVKNKVACDLEWNSKDQTFDRDLYAVRAFYECGIIDAAILITRGTDLSTAIKDISIRGNPNLPGKYGASTTWMGKLKYRLDAGRAGGCPLLAIGIQPKVISDLEVWKAENKVTNRPGLIISQLSDDTLCLDDDD